MTPEIMRTVGKLVRAVYGDDKIPANVQNIILQSPVKGIGLMMYRKDLDPSSVEITRLMNNIPGDLEDPKSMSFDCQGAFWLGYYHYAKLKSDAANYGRQELEALGKVLYGEQWQSNLSRDLGLSSPRRIREWISGDRKIPTGVWDDIAELLRAKQLKISELLK